MTRTKQTEQLLFDYVSEASDLDAGPVSNVSFTEKFREYGNIINHNNLTRLGIGTVTPYTCNGFMIQETAHPDDSEQLPTTQIILRRNHNVVTYDVRGTEEYGYAAFVNRDFTSDKPCWQLSPTAAVTKFSFQRDNPELEKETNGEYFAPLERHGYQELERQPSLRSGWLKQLFQR